MDIPIGLKNEMVRTITEKDTAAAFGSGLVPVFATPAYGRNFIKKRRTRT